MMRLKSKVFRFIGRDPITIQKAINKWLCRMQQYCDITIEQSILSSDNSEVGTNLIIFYRQEQK